MAHRTCIAILGASLALVAPAVAEEQEGTCPSFVPLSRAIIAYNRKTFHQVIGLSRTPRSTFQI